VALTESLTVDRQSFVEATAGQIPVTALACHRRQVLEDRGHEGMLWAQQSSPGFDRSLQQRQRGLQIPLIMEDRGQVVRGGQNQGVILPKQSLAKLQNLFQFFLSLVQTSLAVPDLGTAVADFSHFRRPVREQASAKVQGFFQMLQCILISMLIKMAAVVLLGVPVIAVIIFEVILNGMAMFNHGNIRLPKALDSAIRLLFVTPDMHRVHHSILKHETNSNYGFNLSIWDRLFGSYHAQPDLGHDKMTIGLEQYQTNTPTSSILWMLKLPFTQTGGIYSQPNIKKAEEKS